MDHSIQIGRKNSVEERFAPDFRASQHLSFVHVREVNKDWFYPSHEHKQYEINYVLSGCQALTVNGTRYRQQAGDLAFIQPGDLHASESCSPDGFAYFCLHFEIDDPPLLQRLRTAVPTIIPGSTPEGASLRPVIEQLIERTVAQADQTASTRARLQAAFFQLLALLAELPDAEDRVAAETPGLSLPNGWADKARQIEALLQAAAKTPVYHGEANRERRIVGDAAGRLGISESHCNRLFRRAYGLSPRQYVSRMMLEEAMRLLRDLQLSIDTISSLLGYKDIAHFSRQFKRWTGESPSAFRKRQPSADPSGNGES